MFESSAVTIAFIGLTAFLCQLLAWRVRLPAILFLLAAGILVGPVTGLLHPDQLFGDLLFPLISLSVAIILFEGSLTLNIEEIRAQRSVVQKLITRGAAITWIGVAVTSRYLFDLSWDLSILFGALTVVTGPTVIIPMLRTVRPNANAGNILRWEGILIDPLGALLVVVVYEFIVAQSQAIGLSHSIWAFLQIVFIGTLFGVVSGWFLGLALRRHWVPVYLQNLATLSMVFLAFSISNKLAHESGLLAVTLMGMWLANQKNLHIEEIINFKENLSVVLISGLFILLAARLELADIAALGWAPLVLLLIMQLLIRPASVWASAMGSSLNWREKSLLSWIAPRGIVAAAVSALFAIKLEGAGFEQANVLVPLTFIVIVGTVVLQSATAGVLARILKVAEPKRRGFLMLGANSIARAIAKALGKHDIRVMLADTNWENIKTARMDGLDTFYGNPVSEYAEHRLDLVGIGKLLALSPDPNSNAVAGMHFRDEFGMRNIYTLQTSAEARLNEKHHHASEQRGKLLFDKEMTYGKLASMLAQGAELRSTKLTEEFDFGNFLKTNAGIATPLFAITPQDRVRVFVIDEELQPASGWIIISLFTAQAKETEESSKPKSA